MQPDAEHNQICVQIENNPHEDLTLPDYMRTLFIAMNVWQCA